MLEMILRGIRTSVFNSVVVDKSILFSFSPLYRVSTIRFRAVILQVFVVIIVSVAVSAVEIIFALVGIPRARGQNDINISK